MLIMRNPFEGVSPTKLQVGVAAVAAAHVLAILIWVILVCAGVVGTKTTWEAPPEPRQPRRRAAAASARSDAAPSEAALRRRRRKQKREDEAEAMAAAAAETVAGKATKATMATNDGKKGQ